MANSMISDREDQIMRWGCPICGANYDIIVNDKEGVLFQCHDKECTSGRPRIPYKRAALGCPKDEKLILKIVSRRKVCETLKHLDCTIRRLAQSVHEIKTVSGKHQELMMKYKSVYKSVRDIKLFDKQGNRIYSNDNPFVFIGPKTGEAFQISNIKQKRKAKTMLLCHWWTAKEIYNSDIDELIQCRKELREAKQQRQEMQEKLARIDAALKESKTNLKYIEK